MNDETRDEISGDMSGETVDKTTQETTAASFGSDPATGTTTGAAQAGFCQDCGRVLTADSVRRVGSGIFCEPCLAVRAGVAGTPIPPPVASGDASPVLAAFLGFIPGVGAMYNGQFAKGIVHLIVFAVLVTLKDNVNSIFGLLVFGWICYQVFDAYHTAKARVEGLPLPNPFGLNEIGDRLGFGKNWPATGRSWSSVPPSGSVPPAPTPPVAASSTTPGWTTVPAANPYTAVDPAASPTQTAQAMAASIRDQAVRDAGYAPTYPPTYAPGYAPTYPPGYTPTYTPTYAPADPTAFAPASPAPSRRFPVGALWLIGLGLLVLIGNVAQDWGFDWSLSGRWVAPVVLAVLSVYLFTRRLGRGVRLACILRWPVILMVLAVLLALQAADVVPLWKTWSVLLVAIGAVLLLERTAGAGVATPVAGYVSPVPASAPPTAAEVDAERTRAAWAATEATPAAPVHDETKGGF